MIVWHLLITLYLGDTVVHLPPAKDYITHGECENTGIMLTEWLTQDGVKVEWKCVEVEK